MTSRHRAYSFPMVMMLCILIASAAMVAMVAMQVSVETTNFALGRREAFYTCDGVARTLAVAARPYLRSTTAPTTNGLMTSVCSSTALPCTTGALYVDNPAYTITKMRLQVAGTSTVAPVPNGPFRMMNARQNPISIEVELENPTTKDGCYISQRMQLAEIGLFQFFVFSDGYMDLFNGPPMTIDGRVHVNGDFCAHDWSGSIPILSQVTASGRIYATCTRSDGLASGSSFYVKNSAGVSTIMNGSCDSGCVACSATCPGDVGAWRAFALSRWDGNVQDQEHGVPALRLPVPAFPPVQDGLDTSGARIDNSQSLRMLLDPPQLGEPIDISQQRYAWKADLRIIDGIWFKNNGTWPGTPIWSDHPGAWSPPVGSDQETVLHGTTGLGQTNIASLCANGARRYSYYAHDCASPGSWKAFPGQPAVVSYGAVTTAGARRPARDNANAVAANAADLRAGLATGFIDHRVFWAVDTDPITPDIERHRILPMNFSLDAFTAAMSDTTAGELGSFFPDGADADAAPDFNGIVYIHLSWPGSTTAKVTTSTGDDPPVLPPRVDLLPAVQPVCGVAPYELEAGGAAPTCVPANVAWPNAVRLTNGGVIDKTVFPKGLSIVTNAPAYLLDDMNAGSVTATAGTPSHIPHATDWVPFMVGADAVTFLSGAWQDTRADWSSGPPTDGDLLLRNASATTYGICVLAGNVETSAASWGGGINNFPRFLENWGAGNETVIYGSLVIGFRSVWQRQQWIDNGGGGFGNDVYNAPLRTWLFDTNLTIPSNQPPGTPSFFIQAIDDFQRD